MAIFSANEIRTFFQKYIFFKSFSDLKLNSEESNQFASVTMLGFPIGGLMCGICVSYIGKRYSSIFGLAGTFIMGTKVLSFIVGFIFKIHFLIFQGHLLITFAKNTMMLYVGRIFAGICQGSMIKKQIIFESFCLTFIFCLIPISHIKVK